LLAEVTRRFASRDPTADDPRHDLREGARPATNSAGWRRNPSLGSRGRFSSVSFERSGDPHRRPATMSVVNASARAGQGKGPQLRGSRSGPSSRRLHLAARRPAGSATGHARSETKTIIRAEVTLAAFLALAGFAATYWLENQISARNEVLENARFVRQVAIDGARLKPFDGLRLSEADLGGLNLGCAEGDDAQAAPSESGCARFAGSDLRGANLSGTELTGANLSDADLRGAVLNGADLAGANLLRANLAHALLVGVGAETARLISVDLSGADLASSDLTGANLRDSDLRGTNFAGAMELLPADLTDATLDRADLRGADFTGVALTGEGLHAVCYDETTRWPQGFDPPGQSVCSWPQY